MITDKDSLAYWVDEASFTDPTLPTDLEPKGMTVLTAHWQSCFYYWGGHTLEKRQALANCIDAYIEYFDQQLTWGFKTQPSGRWRAVWRKHTKTFAQVLQDNSDPGDAIEYHFYSGDPAWEDYASPFVISCMTNRNWNRREGSYLSFRVPYAYLLDAQYRPIIDKLITDCIQALDPYYAVSGLEAATPYSQNQVATDVYIQAQKYLGIMQGIIYSDTNTMHQGLKSLDWLTYISRDLAKGYGSAERFYQMAIEQGIDIYPLAAGYMIQASELPQILPIQEIIPDSYHHINNLLRPLRNGNYNSLSIGGWEDEPPRFGLISSDAWIRRFDAPNIFPITIDSPIEVKSIRKHRIKSGKVCLYSGRYRYNADTENTGRPLYHEYDVATDYEVGFEVGDFRQFVVLNKGDIVPYYLDLGQHGDIRQVIAIEWSLVSEFVESNI